MIEINEVRILLPAFVTFKENGEEKSVFVYIDGNDLIIPDMSGISVEFKQAFLDFYKKQKRVYKTPDLPRDMLKDFNPRDYTDGTA